MIASELFGFASAARAMGSMAPAYKALMHALLWMWTADAYDAYNEEFLRDGLKYNFHLLRHTEEAHEEFRKSRRRGGLIHEHAVPRRVLIQYLLANEMDVASIASFLEAYCFGVIVTAAQDGGPLGGSLKSAMPPNWQFGPTQDPLARYRPKLDVHGGGECPTCSRDAPQPATDERNGKQ